MPCHQHEPFCHIAKIASPNFSDTLVDWDQHDQAQNAFLAKIVSWALHREKRSGPRALALSSLLCQTAAEVCWSFCTVCPRCDTRLSAIRKLWWLIFCQSFQMWRYNCLQWGRILQKPARPHVLLVPFDVWRVKCWILSIIIWIEQTVLLFTQFHR